MNLYKQFIFSFFGVCLLLFGSSACYSQNAAERMTEALKARSKGNIKEAINLLKTAVSLANNDKQKNMANFMLGDCLIESEKYSEASKVYEDILNCNLTNDEKSEAYFNLMKSYASLGNNSKVKQIYKKLFSEVPKSSFANLAKSYYGNIFGDSTASTDASAAKKTVKAEVTKKQETKTSPSKPSKKEEKKSDKLSNPFEEKKANSKTSKSTTINANVKKVSNKTSALLKEILTPKNISDSKREELASSILLLQDKIKGSANKIGVDALLFELAKNTADFGEYVEACKSYDKLLNNYPSSPYVEEAYYEAIRLRAMLGVHEAVISWGNAFLKTFASSKYTDKVKALIEYSKSGGKIQLENIKASTDNVVATIASHKTKNDLLKDIRYKTASQYMKDGNYEAALNGFKSLGKEYTDVSQLWWDTALVNVQMENFKEAATAINKMLELEPNNEDANSLSGYINYRLENYEEAANAYENLSEPEGHGVNFFDAKSASQKMRKSAKNN